MKKTFILVLTGFSLLNFSCKKDEDKLPKLIFKFHFDPSIARLDNFGNPVGIPSGHSAQSPSFNKISAHYIEFANSAYTQLGQGEVVFHGSETTAGGSKAVDFDKAVSVSDNEVFYSIPLRDVEPGEYNWLRVSLTYQNYKIKFKEAGTVYEGTLASFVGFNTYITNYKIGTQSISLNQNKLQGYWGFETLGLTFQGHAPSTTVPNPIASTSPIPAGSCVVTGSFPETLKIKAKEKKDIIVTVNLSINNSFEWKDQNMDGYYEPNAGDTVVDMGIRGLFPKYAFQ